MDKKGTRPSTSTSNTREAVVTGRKSVVGTAALATKKASVI
jgi:hypothetical protein